MGYYVKIKIKNFVVLAGSVEGAHTTLKELWTPNPTGWLLRRREASFSGPEGWRGYDWVHYRKGGWPSLVEELSAWRYDAVRHSDGSVELLAFTGEKWGDDETLYRALAPFVAGKACIHIIGEEGDEWRHLFGHGAHHLEHRNTETKTQWSPMPFWGEGKEREEAIADRAKRKELGIMAKAIFAEKKEKNP